ncbi:MAG: nicotinamide-nucleotide amidase [Solirubrobacteraceae bacterium]|nr:nicotinamide-nucleotide amidase [Solirubrobacteraceae bacterium]
MADLPVSARAGIVVTGTEVLTGIIPDGNGPWLSERLREIGVDCAQILIVGDRAEDMRAALDSQAALGVDLIVTTGGLGPTADDLTATVVGEWAEREMVLDPALEQRIWAILQRLSVRWRQPVDQAAVRAANRKQAVVPEGATILEPVGTAPGLVVPPVSGAGPTVLVLPGPPRELQPMWRAALETDALRAAIAGAVELRRGMLRLFGIPESEIARTLESIAADGVDLAQLEITTCLRRGEIEVATVYEPAAAGVYGDFVAGVRERHARVLFSEDGATIDAIVAQLLGGTGLTIATAESCTGGLLAGRLTDLAGSSAYVAGGVVVYSNEAKTELAGVDPALIAAHGAVSPEVADALADGARDALDASVGVGVTGIAGPGGGTEDKPVGTVCLAVSRDGGARVRRTVHLPGDRFAVRDRTTTVAMHLVRELLLRDAGAV